MLDINLLPPEYGPKKVVKLVNLIIISLSFLICLSLLMSSLKIMAIAQDYSARVDYHESQIKLYRRQVEDIHELAGKVKLLKSRLYLVKELLEERDPWSEKFVELSQCLPLYGAWMDSVTVERQKVASPRANASSRSAVSSSVMAHIAGRVTTVDKASQFIANLEDSSTFGDIVFNSAISGKDSVVGDTILNFKFSVAVSDQAAIFSSHR